MAITQEKNYQRQLTKDRRSDLNFNSPSLEESLSQVAKQQGSVDESLRELSGPSLQESLKQVEASQKNPAELNEGTGSGVSVDDQAAMRRRLEADKLQARNQQDQSQAGEQSTTKTAVEADKDKSKSLRGQWQKIKNERQQQLKKLKGVSGQLDPSSAAFQELNKEANRIIKQAWGRGHMIVEELLYDIFYLAFLFAVPYLLLCFGRLIVGMIGMLKIRIKKIEVNLVPFYSLQNGGLTLLNNFVFMGIAAIEWLLITLIIRAFWKPLETVWDFSLFGIIWNWFF